MASFFSYVVTGNVSAIVNSTKMFRNRSLSMADLTGISYRKHFAYWQITLVYRCEFFSFSGTFVLNPTTAMQTSTRLRSWVTLYCCSLKRSSNSAIIWSRTGIIMVQQKLSSGLSAGVCALCIGLPTSHGTASSTPICEARRLTSQTSSYV